MAENGKGQRVSVYFGEADHWQHQSLAMALLEMLRREGCSGATVTRGVAGFGAGSRIKTSTVLRLSFDLPMILTIIDTHERVARVLPKLREMVGGGLITVEEVEIYQYSSRFKETLPDLPTREVMATTVVTVHPETPLAEAVALLLQHVFTALPVVDTEQHLLGMLYEADLLAALDIDLPLSLHGDLREQLARHERTVATVMTREVLTIDAEASLRTAAHLMLTREVKQLPVVTPDHRLVGIISRIDLLQAVGAGYLPQEGLHPIAIPTGEPATPVSEIMHTTVPTVSLEASLADVATAMLGSVEWCALVLDANGCLAGIITTSDMVQRLDPEARPGVMQILRSHLPLTGYTAERQAIRKVTGRHAQEIMTTPVVSVSPTTPISTALLLATQRRLKRLPICDTQQRPTGLVGRKDLLRAFVR
jgi:CBS-domain-containing membrane protein